ncbi:MAG: glycosyltransferase family 2 protein [Corynebacteriales bacterium]|nr:glycosyltransferase family 2 protein [Mycobacteriales bacterium]
MNTAPSVSVVIPCYGSESTLPELVDRLHTALPTISERYEVILVVDDPPDGTWDVAQKLAETYPLTRALQMSRNYGQQNAYFAGVRAARHEIIVTMDDDLQHPPEEIGKLLEGLTEDVDLVYGVPKAEEHGFFRSLASRGVKRVMAKVLGIKHASSISSFRAFRSFLRKGFDNLRGSHGMLDVTLSWATTRIKPVTIHMEKDEGNSSYTFKSLVRHAMNLLLGYSTKPLRFVTYLGGLVGLVGLGLLCYVIFDYFTNPDGRAAGWASLACMVAIFSAAQMIAVGVIGEYLGRLFTGSMGKPAYLVRQRVEKTRS